MLQERENGLRSDVTPGPSAVAAPPEWTSPSAIVAVFPSAKSLAAAFPQAAAKGEEGIASENSDVCPDSDHMHWLARANVLVGVKFDSKLGADGDPVVAEARADLLKLAT